MAQAVNAQMQIAATTRYAAAAQSIPKKYESRERSGDPQEHATTVDETALEYGLTQMQRVIFFPSRLSGKAAQWWRDDTLSNPTTAYGVRIGEWVTAMQGTDYRQKTATAVRRTKLKSGQSVVKYKAAFDKKLRLALAAGVVADDAEIGHWFAEGLKPKWRKRVSHARIRGLNATYDAVVDWEEKEGIGGSRDNGDDDSDEGSEESEDEEEEESDEEPKRKKVKKEKKSNGKKGAREPRRN